MTLLNVTERVNSARTATLNEVSSGRSRVTDHRPGTYELPCPLQGQVSTRTRTETPFAELPERSLQRPLNRGAPTTLSANSRRRPTAGKPLGHGSTRASVGRSASGADSFGVVTERSAVRVSDPPPLSGIDLVRESRIILSPNSNPVAEVVSAVTPDQWRDATREEPLSTTQRRPLERNLTRLRRRASSGRGLVT